MKTKKNKSRNKATSGWSKTDAKAAQKERALFRAWMDRIRLTDVANELAALEKMYLFRAELMTDMVNPLMPEPGDARWRVLAQHERELSHQMFAMREKIGWVLEP